MIRRDLPLGVIGAQLIHAAGHSAALSSEPLPAGTHAVALMVPDERALREVVLRLREAQIPHVEIHEPDPPWNGALMAVGVHPTSDRVRLRRCLGRYPLLS